jgi:hypothetical protein
MTQSLEQQATQFLHSKNLRWDGRNFANTKNVDKVKAQVAFEKRLVVCPFSGRSTRKR